jgi:hypothetical protein
LKSASKSLSLSHPFSMTQMGWDYVP